MMSIMLVSRENCMRKTGDVTVPYALRVPALRLPRAVRWGHYSEVLAARPGQVGRICADDE